MAKQKPDIKEALKKFKSNEGEFEFSRTAGAVAESFEDLIRKLQDNIKKSKHGDDQGESVLGASVVAIPSILGSKVVVEVRFEKYGFYVNDGIRPKQHKDHKQLIGAMLNYISRRPRLQRKANTLISSGTTKTLKDGTVKKIGVIDAAKAKLTLAAMMSAKIYSKGTKGSKWFTNEIQNGGQNWEKLLAEKIQKALGLDVTVQFKIIAEEFNK